MEKMDTAAAQEALHIFDSHAHYDSGQFQEDLHTLLPSLFQKGVCGIMNCGTDLPSSRFTADLCSQYAPIYGAAGIHPECAGNLPKNWEQELEEILRLPKMVAVGEIGLDYHWKDNPGREVQKEVFAAQLRLANRLGLPVIVHDRDAHGDTMERLRQYRPKGVVHCFSGSVEMMREAVQLGLYIGLGGAVTFKNARVPVQVAAEIPLDRLLTETDCPYMAPVPFRGKRCDSSMIAYSAGKIAEIKGIPLREVLEAGKRNAEKLFSLPSAP